MYQVAFHKEELESRASGLISNEIHAFQNISIRSPRLTPPELGFYLVLTWLYVFYYEGGRISFPFLLERFVTFGLDNDERHSRHFEEVRKLRTYFQHNLDLTYLRDAELREQCEQWFADTCGSRIPGDEREWTACLLQVLASAEAFLVASIECVRAIERDESSTTIIDQWLARLRQHHPRHEFESLVRKVIHDMGQDALDPQRITERHYDKWTNALRFVATNYKFEEEARKLIESTLLSESELPLPISGSDIMREFSLPPGREVGRLLEAARNLYKEDPVGKTELIERIRCNLEGE